MAGIIFYKTRTVLLDGWYNILQDKDCTLSLFLYLYTSIKTMLLLLHPSQCTRVLYFYN